MAVAPMLYSHASMRGAKITARILERPFSPPWGAKITLPMDNVSRGWRRRVFLSRRIAFSTMAYFEIGQDILSHRQDVELQRQFLALRRAGALPLQVSLERRSLWSCALLTHRELSFVFSLGASLPPFLPNQVTLQLHFRCSQALRSSVKSSTQDELEKGFALSVGDSLFVLPDVSFVPSAHSTHQPRPFADS